MWNSKELPNIADYQHVIVNTDTLTQMIVDLLKGKLPDEIKLESFSEIVINLYLIKDRLIHVMNSNGNIYVVCSPKIQFKWGKSPSLTSDNYEWSPFRINIYDEKGETINVMGKHFPQFAHYFTFVNKWSFCFPDNFEITLDLEAFYGESRTLKLENKIIAENRYRRPIAIESTYDVVKWEGSSPNRRRYLERTSGSMFLLPPPTELSVDEGINLLLEDFWAIQQKTAPPKWLNEILVPNEDRLIKEIDLKQSQIGLLNQDVVTLNQQKAEVSKYKQLLYETGIPLENICKLVFQQLGCEVSEEAEDFVLRKGDNEVIVEIKGREGVIERKDGAQLSQNRRNYAIQKGKNVKEIKAILLANPWRLLPIGERVNPDLFAPHLIEDAKVEDMALLTTEELFRAYCAFLNNEISDEKILNRIFASSGLTKIL